MSSSPDSTARSGRARRADRWVVSLADALRAEGIGIGVGQVVACRRALVALGSHARHGSEGNGPDDRDTSDGLGGHDDPDDCYWAARSCLITDPRHFAVFDRVFRRFEHEHLADPLAPTASEAAVDAGTDGGEQPGDPLVAGARASRIEQLRHRRFSQASPEELAEIARVLERLRVGVPHRTTRRRRPGRRGELDLGRTLERSLATDGELLERAWRQRRTRPRRLVVVLDVSGSMAVHARLLLRFALAARRTAEVEVSRRVEVFAFATRLTRLSDALAMRDPDEAIARAAERVVDFDGGTRIGASVDELVRVWGRRGVLRGAVVLICSDGLERGDPAALATAMRRLAAQAHRVVWVNPLVADPDFAPVQRGMAVALPFVDSLRAGDDLAGLEALARAIE
jgi:uncharacterized protein